LGEHNLADLLEHGLRENSWRIRLLAMSLVEPSNRMTERYFAPARHPILDVIRSTACSPVVDIQNGLVAQVRSIFGRL